MAPPFCALACALSALDPETEPAADAGLASQCLQRPLSSAAAYGEEMGRRTAVPFEARLAALRARKDLGDAEWRELGDAFARLHDVRGPVPTEASWPVDPARRAAGSRLGVPAALSAEELARVHDAFSPERTRETPKTVLSASLREGEEGKLVVFCSGHLTESKEGEESVLLAVRGVLWLAAARTLAIEDPEVRGLDAVQSLGPLPLAFRPPTVAAVGPRRGPRYLQAASGESFIGARLSRYVGATPKP